MMINGPPTLEVRQGRAVIDNLDEKDQWTDLDLKIVGPLASVLRTLDSEPFRFARAVGLSPASAQGETTTQLKLRFIAEEAERTEDTRLDAQFSDRIYGRIDQAIAMGALFTAYHLGCKAIIALTESGSTPLWMSRHNIHVPIYGLTSQPIARGRMALYRNVRALLVPRYTDREQALAEAENLLVASGVLRPGDTYAITCGEPMGTPGGTNMLKVCRVG